MSKLTTPKLSTSQEHEGQEKTEEDSMISQ